MEKLINRDESIISRIEDPEFSIMRWKTTSNEILVHFHSQTELATDRFIDIKYGQSKHFLPKKARIESGTVSQLVEAIEFIYQLDEDLAIFASPSKGDLGYTPDYKTEDRYLLVPLSRKQFERFPLEQRLDLYLINSLSEESDLSFLLKRLANNWGTEYNNVLDFFLGFHEPKSKVRYYLESFVL